MEKGVVFFGSGPYVIPILQVLKSDFELHLVITTEKVATEPVLKFCKANNLQVFSADNTNSDIINNAIRKKIALVGILAHFGKIISSSLLDLFPMGIINIHPSLLPKYRGPTPGQAAILAGDKSTGITIIKLDDQIDHGPILVKTPEYILPNDTCETLYKRLFAKGADLLKEALPKYLNNKMELKEQNHNQATYTKRLTKRDGYIDLNNPPDPVLLDRMIRAFWPWPKTWTKFPSASLRASPSASLRTSKIQNSLRLRSGRVLRLRSGRVLRLRSGRVLRLRSGQAKFKMKPDLTRIIKLLPGAGVQVEGGKPMTYKDFINGYSTQAKILLEKLGVLPLASKA